MSHLCELRVEQPVLFIGGERDSTVRFGNLEAMKACAGYLVYPFQNQEGWRYAGNLQATYLVRCLLRKSTVRASRSALVGTDIPRSSYSLLSKR